MITVYGVLFSPLWLKLVQDWPVISVSTMDEGSKGIRHGGVGAYLRCPVFTTVHFSLRDEGSSEYIQVCEGRESLRPNF
jgi:hypothetical protein